MVLCGTGVKDYAKAARENRGAAFTLVEGLITVVIISILAALLLPVISRSRERAKETSCLSNLRQLAISLELYANDADGFLPPYSNSISFLSAFDPAFSLSNACGSVDAQMLAHGVGAYSGKEVLFCPLDLNAREPVVRNNVCHEWSSYEFRYALGGKVGKVWPINVRLDDGTPAQILIQDGIRRAKFSNDRKRSALGLTEPYKSPGWQNELR